MVRWTISNYILLIWRIIAGIITTRLLYLGLGDVGYGYWVLLWSVFGYSLLLDFGFGTSVQKYAAELLVTKDFKLFNKQISTIIGSYLFMGLLIIMFTALGAYFLTSLFTIEAADVLYYQQVFFLFGVGSALLFPLGAFAEVLKGIGKLHIRNVIEFGYVTLNLIGIYLLMEYGYSVLELTLFSLGLNLIKVLFMAGISFYFLPKMELKPRHFKLGYIKEIISFSFFAYLIMFSNMIIHKTDQILVGAMLGMAPVAIYQVGSRLSYLLDKFSTQFQDTLAPVAAKLNHAGEKDRLRHIMFQSNRIVTLGTTLLFAILIFLTEPILKLWLEVTDHHAISISYIMLLSVYLLTIFRSANSKILLMSGKHKFLSKVAVIESISNVALSILFIKLYGVIGVAIGTLIPNIILSIFVIFPAASRFSAVSKLLYFKKIFLPTLLIALIPSLILYLSRITIQQWDLLTLMVIASITSLVYILLSYRFYTNEDERNRIKSLLKKVIKRSS